MKTDEQMDLSALVHISVCVLVNSMIPNKDSRSSTDMYLMVFKGFALGVEGVGSAHKELPIFFFRNHPNVVLAFSLQISRIGTVRFVSK